MNYKKFIHYFKKNKNRIAIINNKKKITFSDILNFKEKYFNCKKKVFLLFSNDYFETIFLYSSLLISENIIILIDFIDDNNYLKLIIKKYKPNYVILPNKKFLNLNIAYKKIHSLKKNNIFQLVDNKKISYNIENKLLLSTSGTTGSPKMVQLSEKNLLSNAESICSYLKIIKEDSCITTLSPSYSYGLSIINSHLLKGAKIFINQLNIANHNFWKFVQLNKISSISFIPAQLEILAKYNFFNKKLNSIKYMTSAGGKLQENVINFLKKFCEKRGILFYVMYGQTEASPRISYYKLNKTNLGHNCIGKPINKGKLMISGKNKIGEIIYSGPNIYLGYAENHLDLKKKISVKKKLNTGDIGYKDQHDNFYVLERKKRIAKINGLRISLDHLEEIFKKKNIVTNCYSVSDKISIYTKNSKFKNYINNYLKNILHLNKDNYSFISKQIKVRKK